MRVIILTSFLDSAHVLPAIRSGAAGYLLKDILPDDLFQAIIAVHNGQSVLHPKVITQIASNLRADHQSEIDLINSLSERELVGAATADARLAKSRDCDPNCASAKTPCERTSAMS